MKPKTQPTALRPLNAAHLKPLGHPARLEVLRHLMRAPASLTVLGKTLGASPANIRHHLKILEAAGLVDLVARRAVRGFVEKRYRATALAYQVNFFITPAEEGGPVFLITGSDDPALRYLCRSLADDPAPAAVRLVPTGSLNGLIALRQGLGGMAAVHLFDPATGSYNEPHVRVLFPDRNVRLIAFVTRTQGLIVPKGNPARIRDLADVAGTKARFINRNRGSGTRLLVNQLITDAHIEAQAIEGYTSEAGTHEQVALAVAGGAAAAGMGVLAAAAKAQLDFIPLREERFDLIIPEENLEHTGVTRLLARMREAPFRKAVEAMGGYGTDRTGTVISLEN
jgi:putative molybdopterin biosynthesis protein